MHAHPVPRTVPTRATASLLATVGLLVAAAATVAAGIADHAVGLTAVSLVCTTVAAATLAGFARAVRGPGRPAPAAAVREPEPPPPPCPIAGYAELGVADILPLLQELDEAGLRAVAWHEHLGRSRPGVLARVTALLAQREQEGEAAGARRFPIDGYERLRVVDILPLLARLSASELDAVAARERAGAGRVTVLARIDRLRRLAARAGGAGGRR